MGSLLEIDQLQLYFGDPYTVNQHITIHQPNIGQIMEYGERAYYSLVHTICAIPSDMKSQLEDMGFDYEQVEDFQLFMMLAQLFLKNLLLYFLAMLILHALKLLETHKMGKLY